MLTDTIKAEIVQFVESVCVCVCVVLGQGCCSEMNIWVALILIILFLIADLKLILMDVCLLYNSSGRVFVFLLTSTSSLSFSHVLSL